MLHCGFIYTKHCLQQALGVIVEFYAWILVQMIGMDHREVSIKSSSVTTLSRIDTPHNLSATYWSLATARVRLRLTGATFIKMQVCFVKFRYKRT